MKKIIMILLMGVLMFSLVKADVNATVTVDSDGGNIGFWANPNSGNGSTTYYLDGVNYRQSIKDAANSRSSIVSRVYKSFMQWRRQPTGGFAWDKISFESLEPEYQKLRYVLETWFVPRKEMIEVINRQQQQINQLYMEIESIQKILGDDIVCDARKQVMEERNLPYITCGNITWYPSGIGINEVD